MKSRPFFPSLRFKEDYVPLLKLAIPLVITGVIQSSVSFFNVIFLARLGEQVLAATALVTTLFFTLVVLFFGIFSSVNILISHKFGAKDDKAISLILRDGLILAILLSVPTFFLFRYVAIIFLWFGQKTELVTLAHFYLLGLSWGLLPKFILLVLFDFVIGLGHPRVSMMFTLLSIPLYIFFSYVLILGKYGFPAMGIAGAGWGLTIGDWITTLIVIIFLFFKRPFKHYLYAMFTFDKPSYLWELFHIGAPMGLMFTIEVGFFFALSLLMGIIGIPSLAANQITIQYLGPLMGVIFCIAQAITVRMGHNLGAKQVYLAERAAYAGITLSALLMIVVAFFYWLMPDKLIAVDFNIHDVKNLQTVAIAQQFFFFAAFFQILEAIRIALFGALRGLKDTKFTLLTSFISFWCIALPIGYVLANSIGLFGIGYWWGMIMGACASIFLLYLRFRKKIRSWKLSSL